VGAYVLSIRLLGDQKYVDQILTDLFRKKWNVYLKYSIVVPILKI